MRPPVPRPALLLAMALGVAHPGTAQRPSPDPATRARAPIVIGHRGASGHLPEHTLAAYARAVADGADYIEPDLVSSRDGVLFCRHENEIGGTTDVAERFPARRRTSVVDGDTITGWFIEDFTAAEVRTLRARERLATRSHAHDGRDPIPTFDEVLALAQRLGRARGRPVGVYPETKHPSHFRALGLPLEPRLLASLRRAGLDRRSAPVFIQSFEQGNLEQLRTQTRVRLIQLMAGAGGPADRPGTTYAQLRTPDGLRAVARYANGIGAEKGLVLAPDSSGGLPRPTTLVAAAHAAGLLVHVWTLRSDAPFLPAAWRGDAAREVRAFRDAGVDGLFTDFPGDAVQALQPRRAGADTRPHGPSALPPRAAPPR